MREASSQEMKGAPGSSDIIVAHGRVTTVTFNRPAKRNAIRLAMWRALIEIFEALDADPSVRGAILTGRESFSAGADISEFPTNRATVAQAEEYEASVIKALSAISNLSKPTVAAVHGNCIGGGMALAQACDFRISDTTATFGVPAAKLGIVYSTEECRQLASIVGITNAKRILFSAATFDAAEAERIGFATLCPEGEAVEAAQGFLAAMTENAPLSISGMKFILNALADGTADAKAAAIDDKINTALASDDYREAVSSFQQKRKPTFGIH